MLLSSRKQSQEQLHIPIVRLEVTSDGASSSSESACRSRHRSVALFVDIPIPLKAFQTLRLPKVNARKSAEKGGLRVDKRCVSKVRSTELILSDHGRGCGR